MDYPRQLFQSLSPQEGMAGITFVPSDRTPGYFLGQLLAITDKSQSFRILTDLPSHREINQSYFEALRESLPPGLFFPMQKTKELEDYLNKYGQGDQIIFIYVASARVFQQALDNLKDGFRELISRPHPSIRFIMMETWGIQPNQLFDMETFFTTTQGGSLIYTEFQPWMSKRSLEFSTEITTTEMGEAQTFEYLARREQEVRQMASQTSTPEEIYLAESRLSSLSLCNFRYPELLQEQLNKPLTDPSRVPEERLPTDNVADENFWLITPQDLEAGRDENLRIFFSNFLNYSPKFSDCMERIALKLATNPRARIVVYTSLFARHGLILLYSLFKIQGIPVVAAPPGISAEDEGNLRAAFDEKAGVLILPQPLSYELLNIDEIHFLDKVDLESYYLMTRRILKKDYHFADPPPRVSIFFYSSRPSSNLSESQKASLNEVQRKILEEEQNGASDHFFQTSLASSIQVLNETYETYVLRSGQLTIHQGENGAVSLHYHPQPPSLTIPSA